MKYDYAYKYLKVNVGTLTIIIELSISNMLGKLIYSASSNVSFFDDDTWGRACGVGDTEKEALIMCLNELGLYLSTDSNFLDYEECVTFPYRITFTYNDKNFVLLFKKCGNRIELMLSCGVVHIEETDILKYIEENIQILSNQCEINLQSRIKNGFYPTFEDVCCRDKDNRKT